MVCHAVPCRHVLCCPAPCVQLERLLHNAPLPLGLQWRARDWWSILMVPNQSCICCGAPHADGTSTRTHVRQAGGGPLLSCVSLPTSISRQTHIHTDYCVYLCSDRRVYARAGHERHNAHFTMFKALQVRKCPHCASGMCVCVMHITACWARQRPEQAL